MTTLETPGGRAVRPARVLVGVLTVAGLALLTYGGFMHETMGDRTLGHCYVCDPWDPTYVLAPLVVGGALLVLAGVVWRRT